MRCAAFVTLCVLVLASTDRPLTAQARQATSAPRLSITVLVTAMDGTPLPEVLVKAVGPVNREVETDQSGTVTLANLTAGNYRLRFEHANFITLERDVTVVAGKPLKISAALNAAPPPPPPPKVEPPPPAPVAAPVGNYQPGVSNFTSWIDTGFIGRAPSKRLAVGCTSSASTTMVQINEPIAERTRPDADETIYVVAGEATLRMGGREHSLSASSIATIPRGTAHSITRRGSRPFMFVSVLSGPPCQPGQQP
jgi:mannose-6-phosphate isomerase-like protein (cupin superfamily)